MDNTTDLLQLKIIKARNELPRESREAIDAVNWRFIILGMGEKYNPVQLEDLELETELLLCGLITPEEYAKELEISMKLPKEELALLLGQMDQLIFRKMQDELKKIIGIKEEKVVPVDKPLFLDPRFEILPKEIQEAIARSDWKGKSYEIAQKYKLNIEQMGILEEITVKVILNTIHYDKYEEELSSKITIPKEDLSNLVRDINDSVLGGIRELLKKSWQENKQEEKERVPVPPYAKIITYKEPEEKKEVDTKNTEIQIKKIEAPSAIESVIQPTTQKEADTPENINIIEEKLKNATVSDHTISDYSTPKTADPYREII